MTDYLDKYPSHNLDRRESIQDYSSMLMLQGKTNYQNKRGDRVKEQKERLIERFRKIQELIPDTIKALELIPDDGNMFVHLDPGELRVILDYDIPEYKIFRRALSKDSWSIKTKFFNELVGCYHVEFRHKTLRVNLMVDLQLKLTGQCRLVKIGERKPDPIYKVVCE